MRSSPHNIDAEKAALGSVFIASRALDDLGDLAIDDFFLPAHREILTSMRAVAKRGEPVDVILVAEDLKAREMLARLEGGQSYLNDLANAVPTAENARHYAKVVRDMAIKRRLIAACAEIQSAAYGDSDADDLVAEARRKMSGIELADPSGGPTPISADIEATLESIEKRGLQPESYFLPTGLQAFDETISGLRGGNLITIAARPGMGKSAWALDILLHSATRGIPALLFSYEMSKMEIVERALSKRASVNGRDIVRGKLRGPEWIAITDAGYKLAELPLWLDTRPMPVERICSEARRWCARQRVTGDPQGRRKLAVVCVDYIGLIESSGDEDNRALEIARMTRALKLMAAELDIPVLAISQLNRESAKAGRKPMIQDLRDSGSIEQDSNTILFPWWEGTPPIIGKHPATIIVGKNRGGPIGEVDVQWEAQFTRFSDRDDYEHGPVQEALL